MHLVVLLESMYYGLGPLFLVFISCELGERNGTLFCTFEDEINQFDWYQFPMRIQRMLPPILMIAQEPVVVKCFGSASCTRKQFQKVNIDEFVERSVSIFYIDPIARWNLRGILVQRNLKYIRIEWIQWIIICQVNLQINIHFWHKLRHVNYIESFI